MITTTNPIQGELYAFSAYGGVLIPGVYRGAGRGTFQFYRLTDYTIKCLKEGKNPGIEYLGGRKRENRVVRISPDVLDPEERKIYEEFKNLNR